MQYPCLYTFIHVYTDRFPGFGQEKIKILGMTIARKISPKKENK
jgi:hypothetical protein